jgi:hypothetical protein
MKLKTLSVAFLALFLLIGCTEQRKCQKFFKKHPKCFTNDTTIRIDTIKGIEYDTVFIGKNTIDTFTTDSGGVKVFSIVKWKERTVKVNVLKHDTFIEVREITRIPDPIIEKVVPKFYKSALISLILFVLLLMGFIFVLRY